MGNESVVVMPISSMTAPTAPSNAVFGSVPADRAKPFVPSMPVNVSVNIRPHVTAGLANDVEEVKKYAAPIHTGTRPLISRIWGGACRVRTTPCGSRG